MDLTKTMLSIVTGGVLVGAVASQAVPNTPLAVQEPGWRGMVQDQYRMAYTPAAAGGGPEDSTAASLAMASYNPDADARDYAELRPDPEAERFAHENALAAAEADRAFRLAYAEANRAEDAVRVTRGSRAEAAVLDDPAVAETEANATGDETDGRAKIVTMATGATSEI